MKREHALQKKRRAARMKVRFYFPQKMNILLGLENQSSHSQKDRMDPNNNKNT